jgi:UDPglucose--hexose-1-phosphate uridylyltransferase
MSEVRLNHITGDWVIISTERAKRPEDFAVKKEKKEFPAYVATCPFCPGNEGMTPDETFRLTGPDGKWSVRSVPNKFSALTPKGDVKKEKIDFKQVVSGVGLHEVIVETPEHNKTTALLSIGHIEQILTAYRNRLVAFYEDPRVEHVIIFKNHGAGAGTSLEHPHSQIVGTPVFPGQVMNVSIAHTCTGR